MKSIIKKILKIIFPYYLIVNKNNKIIVEYNNSKICCSKYRLKKIKGLEISVNGFNNTVVLKYPFNFIDSRIDILGDNAYIEIGYSKFNYRKLHILFSANASNRKLIIGNNGSFFGPTRLTLQGKDTYMYIGDNFNISHDVNIYNNDNHVIFDRQTGKVINRATGIKIGNNVWIGHKVSILKNVNLGDNIIVGAGSIVTKSFNKNFIAIGGNPAKIIKENINWNMYNQDDYIEEK